MKPVELCKEKSSFLHFTRWLAAFIVLVGHTQMVASLTFGKEMNYNSIHWYYYFCFHAHIAVIMFFVLSGYVVAYSTFIKLNGSDEYRFVNYFIDRWSRIYSVLIAAIILTIVLDFYGKYFNRLYFDSAIIPQDHRVMRLLLNICSLQGLHGYRIQFGSNSALWSIGYEFCYYFIFGLVVFSKQLIKRKILLYPILLGVSVIIGSKMLFYFLIWSMGVFAFWIFHYKKYHLPFFIRIWLCVLAVIANHFIVYKNIFTHNQYIQDLIMGLIFSLILLCDGNRNGVNGFIKRVNTFMSDFSYSLYAYHLPILMFISMSLSRIIRAKHVEFYQLSIGLSIASFFIVRVLYLFTEHQRGKLKALAYTILRNTTTIDRNR